MKKTETCSLSAAPLRLPHVIVEPVLPWAPPCLPSVPPASRSTAWAHHGSQSQPGSAPCYYNYGKKRPQEGEEPEPTWRQDQVPAGAGRWGLGKDGNRSRPDPGWLTAPMHLSSRSLKAPMSMWRPLASPCTFLSGWWMEGACRSAQLVGPESQKSPKEVKRRANHPCRAQTHAHTQTRGRVPGLAGERLGAAGPVLPQAVGSLAERPDQREGEVAAFPPSPRPGRGAGAGSGLIPRAANL